MEMNCKVALIGYGYLSSSLHRALESKGIEVAKIYNRSANRLKGLSDAVATTDSNTFLDSLDEVDLVVEIAHPDVSNMMGEQILLQTNYMPCSVAALANDRLKEKLLETAMAANTKLFLPHGAVVGMDNLVEAQDNWEAVSITFRKPSVSLDLGDVPEGDELVLFEGSVRKIAEKYPRNVNAMVACALATVGLDVAVGRLVVDTRLDNILRGEFEFTGKDGSRLTIIKEEPAAGVSSTGMVTSLQGSVLRALGHGTGIMGYV